MKHMVIQKHCNKCDTTKPSEEFSRLSRSSDGRLYKCRLCQSDSERAYRTTERSRKYNLKKSFGLTLEDYAQMLSKQKGVCAICEREETTLRQGKDNK